MNRREFIIAVAGTVCLSQIVRSPQAARVAGRKRRPNIIFMMADDVGYNDLACYGQKLFLTPRTDQLSDQGTRFTNVYSPSAVCSPTRYSVLTGTDPFRRYHTSHVLFNGEPLTIGQNEATIASLLKDNGYRTGVIGKWHLGLGNQLPRDINNPGRGPNEVGFDYSFIVSDGHNMLPAYYMKNGQIIGDVKSESFQSEVQVIDRLGYKLLQHIPKGTWPNRRPDEQIGVTLADEVDIFMEQNKDHPFFLYYPTCSIHFPLAPDTRFAGQSGIGVYGDYVMEFDWAVGRVMDTLDRLGLADNTLLIVTSDNGGCSVENGFGGSEIQKSGHRPTDPWRSHKDTPYEGGIRVPFLARWPNRIPAGNVHHGMFSLVDLTATAAAVAKIPLPKEAAMDSFNILPMLWDEPNAAVRPYLVAGSRGICEIILRQDSWKLIYWPESRRTELYNLSDDPVEQHDLSGHFLEKTQDLLALLKQHIESGSSRPGAQGYATSFDELFQQKEDRNAIVQRLFE